MQNKLSTRFDPQPFEVIKSKGTMVTAHRDDNYVIRNISLAALSASAASSSISSKKGSIVCICGSIVDNVEEWQHCRYRRRMAALSASAAASLVLSKNVSIVDIDEEWQHRKSNNSTSRTTPLFQFATLVMCLSHKLTSKSDPTYKLANTV